MHCKSSGTTCWEGISICSPIILLCNSWSLSLCWKGEICRWLLLFQEFDFEIVVNLWKLNDGPDHLSRVKNGEELTNIDDGFLDVQLFRVDITDGHYAPIIQFLATGVASEDMSTRQKKQLVVKASNFQLIVG